MVNPKIIKNLEVMCTLTPGQIKDIYELGSHVCEVSSTLAKKELLKGLNSFLNKDQIEALFNLLMNDLYTYGISSSQFDFGRLWVGNEDCELTQSDIKALFSRFKHFQSGNLIKPDFINLVEESFEYVHTSLIDLFVCILDQDWGVGATSNTINKLFGDVVPVFSNTRATDLPVDDIKDIDGDIFIIETKYDGTRDYLIVPPGASSEDDISFMSRNGRVLDIPEAKKDALKIIEQNGITGFVLDAELTLKDSILSDERTTITGIHNSAIAKAAGKNSKLEEGWSKAVTLNVFDFIPYDSFFSFNSEKTKTVLDRKRHLNTALSGIQLDCIKEVPYYTCKKADLERVAGAKFEELTSLGGEGILIKDIEYQYSFDKPNSGWYKVKPVYTCVLKVVGYQESDDRNLVGGIGALICHTEDGLLEVEVGSGLSFKDRGFRKVFDVYEEGADYEEDSFHYEMIKGFSFDKVWKNKKVQVSYFGVTHTKEKINSSLFLPRFDQRAGIIREDREEAYYIEELVGYKEQ